MQKCFLLLAVSRQNMILKCGLMNNRQYNCAISDLTLSLYNFVFVLLLLN